MAEDAWLVPNNAIRQQDEGDVVAVVRDGVMQRVVVISGSVQGEWTVCNR